MLKGFWAELYQFTLRNALSCIFPVFVFGMLAVSKLLPSYVMPRYDFLLLACLAMQVWMYLNKLETKDEVLVICLFHYLGLMMEIYKVRMGSWSYPEFGYSKVLGVPLYSGFMYASVASFMCQAWRRFNLEITGWPNRTLAMLIGIAIYFNFFTHHYLYDLRYVLSVLVVALFYKARVWFSTGEKIRWMPVSLSFILIGLFIWMGEKIATFFGAWKYAHQHDGWQVVKLQKLGSWTLMCIVSYIIVAELKFLKSSQSVVNGSQLTKELENSR
jgi:uncharacterized membrane protein YoaT (DUF817 family)